MVIYLQILYFFGQEDGGRGGGVIGAVDDSDQQKTKQRCVTHSKDHALQVSTLAMAWFFMPCNVFMQFIDEPISLLAPTCTGPWRKGGKEIFSPPSAAKP